MIFFFFFFVLLFVKSWQSYRKYFITGNLKIDIIIFLQKKNVGILFRIAAKTKNLKKNENKPII